MPTAASTYTWATYEAALKAHLGLTGDSSEDTNLERWLAVAAAECDDYCGWIHYDRDTGEQTDDSPTDLTAYPRLLEGILEFVRVYRNTWIKSPEGLKSAKMGPLTETFAGRGAKGLTAMDVARDVAREIWAYEKLNPLV